MIVMKLIDRRTIESKKGGMRLWLFIQSFLSFDRRTVFGYSTFSIMLLFVVIFQPI